jgi:3-oxoacyl-[acyl-carrier-protein] synthase-1
MVYITGYGVISSIGNNVEQTLASLVAQKTGIQQGKQEHTKLFNVGEINYSNDELSDFFQLNTNGSRTSLLGMIAAKEAFKGHVLHDKLRTGLISGTSVGGMDVSEWEYKKYLDQQTQNIETYRHHPSGTTSAQIAIELGIQDYVNTISTACSSAANAIMMGARMIQNGLLDRVVVGGTDSLTKFTISGFRSLMIFDEEWCRPFDQTRKGLNLGEGAGFIVLESGHSLTITKKKPMAVLSGWSNASDAFHQTASSPEGRGAILSMNQALKVANLLASDIDYINAHGTATPNNDLTESKAIQTIFSNRIPPFSSTKAYTGHTLAASGGIEAVISILAIQEKLLFPNLNHNQVIEETKLEPVKAVTKTKQLKHVMSNSFGFSGNNSTIIISAFES